MKYLRSLYYMYEYLFYRTYRWQKRLWGESSAPEMAGLFVPSMLAVMNILYPIWLVTNMILVCFFRVYLVEEVTTLFKIMAIFVCGYFYFSFVSAAKYSKIEKKYIKESVEIRKNNNRKIGLYLFFSLLFFVFCMVMTALLGDYARNYLY